MIKKFSDLVKLDLSKHTQKKPTFYKGSDGRLKPTTEDKWLDYIEWAKVLELLYENGAENVSWISTPSLDKVNTLVITLTIDSKEFITEYPIIDGNSIINQPNQMQLHKAELRGFVKAVAIHTGLGLGLWMKEERQLQETVEQKTKQTIQQEKKILSEDRFIKALENIKSGVITKEKVMELFELNTNQLKQIENV